MNSQKPKKSSDNAPIIIPPSRRPDGTYRKAKKIRPDYVSIDEQILTQASQKDSNGKPENTIAQENKQQILEEKIEDSKSTTRVSNIENVSNQKIVPPEQVIRGINDIDEIETIIKTSSHSILKAIEKFRRSEGILLVQKIAQQYGLKVTIEDSTDSFQNNSSSTIEPEIHSDSQNIKRRKLSTN